MKTIRIAGLMVLLFAAACNGGGDGNGEEDTTSTNLTPVENVNGNIPDTSNSINLGTEGTADTNNTQSNTPR